MGTDLPSLGALTSRLLGHQLGFKNLESSTAPSERGESAAGQENGVGDNIAARIAQTFEAIVYRSQTARLRAAAQSPNETGTSNTSSETSDADQGGQQLFTFFAESRYEELAVFQERIQQVAVASDETQSESLVQTSRRIAARFEVSITISGRALQGFSGAAEELQNDPELQHLLDLVDRFFEESDEFLDQVFSFLDDFFNGIADFSDIGEQFREIYNGFNGAGAAFRQASTASSRQVQLEFNFEFSASITVEQGQVKESDPIVFDLDGDGFELTRYDAGARFDILGSGRVTSTAFVTGGDALLALDRNGNGRIDNGSELFGDQRGAENGYEELRLLDDNGDGRIDESDAAFDQLLLFRDNGDGRSRARELLTLAQADIREIGLDYRETDELAAGGNRLAQRAYFTRNDGSQGETADALLKYLV